jgi:hypothetical protein
MKYDKMLNFRQFILRENDEFLKEKSGDIYGDLQNIQSTMKQIGVDSLVNDIKVVISKCRAIVQGHWLKQQFKYLEALQKAAIALSNAVEEKDDLENVINSAVDLIKNEIIDKISGPINNLGTEPDEAPAPDQPPPQAPPTEPNITGAIPQSAFDKGGTPPIGQPPEGALSV